MLGVSRFGVSGSWFRDSEFLQVRGFGVGVFEVLGFRCSGFRVRAFAVLRFQGSRFRLRGFGYGVSRFGFGVGGFVIRGFG